MNQLNAFVKVNKFGYEILNFDKSDYLTCNKQGLFRGVYVANVIRNRFIPKFKLFKLKPKKLRLTELDSKDLGTNKLYSEQVSEQIYIGTSSDSYEYQSFNHNDILEY